MPLLLAAMAIAAAIVTVAILVFVAIPGMVAQRRSHPHAAAIRLCGYAGPLTLGVSWLFGMIWACTGRKSSRS